MKSMKFSLSVLLVGFIFAFSGCNNDDDDFDSVAQYNKEVAAIDAYLATHHPNAIKDPSGVRLVIKTLGTGLPAQLLSTINIDYKGTLFSNGTVFEESTLNSQLIGLILGWQYAFTILPVGSEATLYIPSALAYGNRATDEIPANSTLVFDVKFNSMTQSQVFNERFALDKETIREYLDIRGINAIEDPNGVWYTINTEGTGVTPTWYNQIKHTYSFRLISNDGVVLGTFNREPIEGFSSRVVDYIQGVALVLTKMKEGGKATIYIPSGLAFGINSFRGENGAVIIPPNANVIVDIELTDVL